MVIMRLESWLPPASLPHHLPQSLISYRGQPCSLRTDLAFRQAVIHSQCGCWIQRRSQGLGCRLPLTQWFPVTVASGRWWLGGAGPWKENYSIVVDNSPFLAKGGLLWINPSWFTWFPVENGFCLKYALLPTMARERKGSILSNPFFPPNAGNGKGWRPAYSFPQDNWVVNQSLALGIKSTHL